MAVAEMPAVEAFLPSDGIRALKGMLGGREYRSLKSGDVSMFICNGCYRYDRPFEHLTEEFHIYLGPRPESPNNQTHYTEYYIVSRGMIEVYKLHSPVFVSGYMDLEFALHYSDESKWLQVAAMTLSQSPFLDMFKTIVDKVQSCLPPEEQVKRLVPLIPGNVTPNRN